jgi:Zn-dependent protease
MESDIQLKTSRFFPLWMGGLFLGAILSNIWNGTLTDGVFGTIIFLVGGYILSTLAHEYAHARVLRHYGYPATIHLTTLGGSTSIPKDITHAHRVTVAVFGPTINFFIYLALTVWARVLPQPICHWAELLAVMNLSLGVLNILPFFPLDGGHILYGILHRYVRRDQVCFAFQSTTLAFSIPIITYAVTSDRLWLVILVFLAFFMEIAFFQEAGLLTVRTHQKDTCAN